MQLKVNLVGNLNHLSEMDDLVHYDFNKNKLYVCGNIPCLGNSNLDKAIEMDLVKFDPKESKIIEWTKTIELDNHLLTNKDSEAVFFYKYFLAQTDDEGKHYFLCHVETYWRHLQLNDLDNCSVEINDNLFETNHSSTDSNNGLSYGWLLNDENEFQFHFFKKPLKLLGVNEAENNITKIEIIPMLIQDSIELTNFTTSQSNYNEIQLNNSRSGTFNAFNRADFYTNVRVRTHKKPKDLAFELKFYKNNETSPFAVSHFVTSESLIKNSLEEFELPVLNIATNKIIGTLKTEVLLITSLNHPDNLKLDSNYNYDYNKQCLVIGHRGMGKTFDAPTLTNISSVENTIQSFDEAFKNGAQMVEFDIVLTKDKVPVIYHDFSFCIKHPNQAVNSFIDIPAIHMTYEEIKKSQIYSHKVLKEANKPEIGEIDHTKFSSGSMFPTLEEMFAQLNPKLGFDVEIKYPLDLEDGTHEADSHLKWPNRNEYADVCIKELYKCVEKYGDERCVIMTTFDPNLCSMLRLKQNKFPVLFLTNGITNKWVPYKDVRTKNVSVSYNFAKAESFQGFVPHAEELFKDLSLLGRLKQEKAYKHNQKFLNISWGDDLNHLGNRQLLIQNGIHGVIYDRISEPATWPNLAELPAKVQQAQ